MIQHRTVENRSAMPNIPLHVAFDCFNSSALRPSKRDVFPHKSDQPFIETALKGVSYIHHETHKQYFQP